MGRTLALLACLGTVAVAAPAAAQGRGDPHAVAYRAVERGFWIGSTAGAIFYSDLPGDGAGPSSGSVLGVEIGVDVFRDLQLGVVLWGQSVGAPSDYRGITTDDQDPKRAQGDFQSMMAGASLRFAFLHFSDENGNDRTFLFARVAGGPTLSRPVGIVDERGTFASAGLGIEYFTRLRHFSVGLEVDGVALMGDAGTATGVAVLPHLKYTF